jgi:hypothetical protein
MPTAFRWDMRSTCARSSTEPTRTKTFALQALDIIYVPRSKIASVNLFVEQYVRNLIPINPSTAVRYGITGAY